MVVGRALGVIAARWRTALPVVWSLLVTAVVIGPMAAPGWVVTLDWATGPSSSFAGRIGDPAALPAGPVFFTLAAVLHGVGGAAVGWTVPAAALVVAGWAGSRLGARTTAGRLAAATAAIWNPFVHERLYAGQPAVLAGYAALVALAASILTAPDRGRWWRWGLWWAVAAACSLQFLVLGGLVAAATGAAVGGSDGADDALPGRRVPARAVTAWAASASLAASCTALWVVPALGRVPGTGDAATVAAFATRADHRWGLAVGTLLGRGFWRPSPAGPGGPVTGGPLPGPVAAVAAFAVVVLAFAGWFALRRAGGRGPILARTTAVVGLVAWVLSWGPSGPFGPFYARVAGEVPGFGLFREAGKFLAVLTVITVVLAGPGADRLYGWLDASLTGRSAGRRPAWIPARLPGRAAVVPAVVVTALVAVVPVVADPTLAWGVGGRLRAVQYPASWAAVADEVRDARPGSVLVLPDTTYLDPGFTGGRLIGDPVGAYFGAVVTRADDPALPGLEPPQRTVALRRALASERPAEALAEHGVTWVLTLAPEQGARAAAAGLDPVLGDGPVALWRNPAAVTAP
jgi:hypothetical protein